MRAHEPKPPRFNRYNLYLIVGLIVLLPVFADRRIQRQCRIDHLLSNLPVHCSWPDEWRWLFMAGGDGMAWLWCATLVVVIGALIWQSFH
jgi:hypothetical protein